MALKIERIKCKVTSTGKYYQCYLYLRSKGLGSRAAQDWLDARWEFAPRIGLQQWVQDQFKESA